MTSTQDLKGLLKAIRKNPNDRVARLALADLYEEQGQTEEARQQRDVCDLILRFQDVSYIKDANKARGFHWFERDTMKAFKSKIYGSVYCGTNGVFFVSSEQFMDNPREYSVRQFHPATGIVETYGNLGGYRTKAQAVAAAKRVADGQE